MGKGLIRSFVAVDPSPETHAALVRLKAELAAIPAEVRWVRDAQLHCTLKFLGGVEPSRLESVHTRLRELLSHQPPLRVEARGMGVFPSMARPRVVWAGFSAPALSELAAATETTLTALGFAREERPFRGHITLGRVSGRRGWDQVKAIVDAHAAADLGATDVDRVVVYRSELRRDGAVYTPLWTIPLGETK